MKTKLKDFLLYSLATVGVVSLFINAKSSLQQTTSTVPESHVWQGLTNETDSYLFNKQTGETRILTRSSPTSGKYQVLTKK
jgi:hypothetical protein